MTVTVAATPTPQWQAIFTSYTKHKHGQGMNHPLYSYYKTPATTPTTTTTTTATATTTTAATTTGTRTPRTTNLNQSTAKVAVYLMIVSTTLRRSGMKPAEALPSAKPPCKLQAHHL